MWGVARRSEARVDHARHGARHARRRRPNAHHHGRRRRSRERLHLHRPLVAKDPRIHADELPAVHAARRSEPARLRDVLRLLAKLLPPRGERRLPEPERIGGGRWRARSTAHEGERRGQEEARRGPHERQRLTAARGRQTFGRPYEDAPAPPLSHHALCRAPKNQGGKQGPGTRAKVKRPKSGRRAAGTPGVSSEAPGRRRRTSTAPSLRKERTARRPSACGSVGVTA